MTTFDCDELVFEVRNARSEQKQVVKLVDRTCTCSKFQEMCNPCSYVIVACMSRAVDYEQFIGSYYSLDKSLKYYKNMFIPLSNSDYWSTNYELPLMLNKNRIRKKGQPKSSRIQNEMDCRVSKINLLRKNHCSICEQSSHNKQTCNVNRHAWFDMPY